MSSNKQDTASNHDRIDNPEETIRGLQPGDWFRAETRKGGDFQGKIDGRLDEYETEHQYILAYDVIWTEEMQDRKEIYPEGELVVDDTISGDGLGMRVSVTHSVDEFSGLAVSRGYARTVTRLERLNE